MINILIVDDKPERYASLISRVVDSGMVQQGGFRSVTNVHDALERLREKRFDILILDMFLPETPWGDKVEDGGAILLDFIQEDDDVNLPTYIIGITAAKDVPARVDALFSSHPWQLLRTATAGNPWEEQLEKLISHATQNESVVHEIEYATDVCIITALRSPEFEALCDTSLNLGENIQIDSTSFATLGTLPVNAGKLSVVAASCLRMGSAESALLSYKLIERFRPKLLIMVGICAGYESSVGYGDAIVANPTWDYTSAKISDDGKGNREVTYSPDSIGVDREIVAKFEQLKLDQNFFQRLHESWKGEKPRNTFPALHIAPSACGPAVIADASVFPDIRSKQNRQTIGLEMEAYGVYCAARMASRPRPLVFSVKSVCDFGSFLKDDKYQKYAAYTSASVAIEFLKRFGRELTDSLRS